LTGSGASLSEGEGIDNSCAAAEGSWAPAIGPMAATYFRRREVDGYRGILSAATGA
jgi:hypothetical protein